MCLTEGWTSANPCLWPTEPVITCYQWFYLPVERSNQVFLVFDEPWLFHNSWGRQTKQIILKREMQEDLTRRTPGPNIWLSKFGAMTAQWLKFMMYTESCPHPGLSSSLFWAPVLPPIKAKFAENIILCIYLKHLFFYEKSLRTTCPAIKKSYYSSRGLHIHKGHVS